MKTQHTPLDFRNPTVIEATVECLRRQKSELQAQNAALVAALEMIASMSGWPASGQQAHPQTDLDHLTRYAAIEQHARFAIRRATS